MTSAEYLLQHNLPLLLKGKLVIIDLNGSDKMIKIKNRYLAVKIDKKGAEIKSVLYEKKEQFWQGDEVWSGTSPILFPFCGGLKDNKYIYNDTEYTCEKHGFAKDMEFEVVKKGKKTVTLVLKATEETLEKYPFDFELNVTYTVTNRNLITEYSVKNNGKNKMYFSVGSHESFLCENGIQNYDILFPTRQNLKRSIMENGTVTNETERITKNSRFFPLLEEQFESASIVLRKISFNSLILRNRVTAERKKLVFPRAENLVLWTVPKREYICIEPWCGLPDMADADGRIEKKEGIIPLKAGKTKRFMHKIVFLPKL
ncbi:MAG: aldose 1-epimerase family protein [Clostridia bacterium]|nr:aldose 1-epimerase family protein [Clostridia bacterium]